MIEPFWRCCLGGIKYTQEVQSKMVGDKCFAVWRPYVYIPCICHLKPKMIDWKKDKA